MFDLKRKLIFAGAVSILILAVVAFVFLPALDGSGRGNIIEFGSYNGKAIEYVQDSFFLNQIQRNIEQYKSSGKEPDSRKVMENAFENTVFRYALMDELESSGYKVPKSVINKFLVNFYLDDNGKYSARRYQETPELTRATRRKQLTEDLTAQRYVHDVFGDQFGHFGLKTSTREIDHIKSMAGPERSFNYVSFSTFNYPDTELAAYGTKNEEIFVNHPVSLITVNTEAEAKKIAASIEKGEQTFEDAVATVSTRDGTDTQGALTRTMRSDLNALFAEAEHLQTVLSLQVGSISSPVKAGNSWALVRYDVPPQKPDFTNQAVLNAVRDYMFKNERGMIEDFFTVSAKNFAEIARAKGFDAACAELKLEKKTTAAFPLNWYNVEILPPVAREGELAPAAANETFLRTAFSLKPSEVSSPIMLGWNILVLQLAEEKAADTQMTELIPMYYTNYAQAWAENSLSASFLSSSKLKDNFDKTYQQYFAN